MKKVSLLKTMLLLFALIAGGSSAWATPIEVLSWSRTGSTDSYSTGFTFATSEKASPKDGYYQDSGTKNSTIVSIALYHATNKLFTTTPTSITFTATLGAGNAKDVLDYPVYACFVDNEGNDIADTEVTVTASIPDKNPNDYVVAMPTAKATEAYGVKIYHMKEDSWNVRYYGFTLTYEAAASGSKASEPTFDPATGTVLTKAQNITVSSTNAVKIIYTTNGDDPTVGGATTTTINASSGSVMIAGAGTITVKAKGIDDEDKVSNLATANYTIKPADPEILPAAREYTTSTNVSFVQADDIDVYYTLDGTDPTSTSTKYNGTPFAITENITIKAIAIDEYGNASDIVVATFSNSDLQETDITVAFNNVFLGTGVGARIEATTTKTYKGITFVFDKISGNNWPQGDENLIRMYKGTTLEIIAPAGYAITNITFTSKGDWKDGMTASVGEYNDTRDGDNKTYWTGLAQSVTFAPGGSHRITEVNIILSDSPVAAEIDATYEWATFCCSAPLDFTGTGVAAYIVTGFEGDAIVKTQVYKVPANTGLLLNGATDNIPLYTGEVFDDVSANKMVAVTTAETISAVSGKTRYVLADEGGKAMFLSIGATDADVPAGKAYLEIDGDGARALNLDGETTAIQSLENNKVNDGVIYDLSGRRVENPTKGIFIMNGKKVVIK